MPDYAWPADGGLPRNLVCDTQYDFYGREILGTRWYGDKPDGPIKLYRCQQEDVMLGQKRPDGGMKVLKIFPGGWAQYKAGRKLFLL